MWSVWYQHVAFSLMNVSIKRLLPTCFHKKENKLVVSVFSTAYYLLLRLRRQLDWHNWRSLLSRSSSSGSPGLLGSTEKLIFRVFFFKSKNSFRQTALNKKLNSASTNFSLIASPVFLSSQPGHFTIQSWNNFWKFLKFISWLYWKVKRRSLEVWLNCSSIPWSL